MSSSGRADPQSAGADGADQRRELGLLLVALDQQQRGLVDPLGLVGDRREKLRQLLPADLELLVPLIEPGLIPALRGLALQRHGKLIGNGPIHQCQPGGIVGPIGEEAFDQHDGPLGALLTFEEADQPHHLAAGQLGERLLGDRRGLDQVQQDRIRLIGRRVLALLLRFGQHGPRGQGERIPSGRPCCLPALGIVQHGDLLQAPLLRLADHGQRRLVGHRLRVPMRSDRPSAARAILGSGLLCPRRLPGRRTRPRRIIRPPTA